MPLHATKFGSAYQAEVYEYGPVVFFFQAEDGIRDADVTGVQTCALPIFDLRQLERERDDDRHVDSARGDQLEALRERPDRLGGLPGPEHLERMGVEGARDPAGAERVRARDREVEDLLVSQVDPVEGAEGDDARRQVRRGGLESPDDPHGVSARAGPAPPARDARFRGTSARRRTRVRHRPGPPPPPAHSRPAPTPPPP